MTFQFAARSGITRPMAFAAPVVWGMIFLPLRVKHVNLYHAGHPPVTGASIGMNGRHRADFYPETVMQALAIGARQLVVHDATETMVRCHPECRH